MMNMIFKDSKWIWTSAEAAPDSYAEFTGTFARKNEERIYLSLSFDSICNAYINGKLVYFKQCADYPHYKLYDRIDITRYCADNNEVRFGVWYLGEDSAVYVKSDAGLIFAVQQGEETLLASDETILSRQDTRYKNGLCKNITHQLGYSFFFDNTVKNNAPFEKSKCIDKQAALFQNPLSPLMLGGRSDSRILSASADNILCDLGREEAGFLSLDIESSAEQTVMITYGEHIVDGNVRRCIDERDFSVEIRLKKGTNTYTNHFRRIAGRYLSIYFENPIAVNYLGIVPVRYPVERKPFAAKSELRQRIYDVCVRTLELCMHEHYEDCPWREQALYSMDSRNQMLCGYYCFGEYAYPRQSLLLMAKGLKENGLLELTYPARNTPAIPFFSLVYPMAVYEYIRHSGDASILDEVAPAIKRIMGVFAGFVAPNGLIANLPYPFWNFYEWAYGSDNEGEITRKPEDPYTEQYDLILSCAYLLACGYCDKLFGTKTDNSAVKSAIYAHFYDSAKGIFRATVGKDIYTELGNSFAILTGVCDAETEKRIAEKLMTGGEMVNVTLSMQCFKYDALLKADAGNVRFVMADIEKNYGYMLENGATSVWETIRGEADFGGAGSLCHGWSAMPIYYFSKADK